MIAGRAERDLMECTSLTSAASSTSTRAVSGYTSSSASAQKQTRTGVRNLPGAHAEGACSSRAQRCSSDFRGMVNCQ